MTTAHSSWAEIYDTAYGASFGDLCHDLTSATIDCIASRIQPPARIVDFGAGTGRLSIPLASMGYQVAAVDSCPEMLAQLRSKPGGERVEVHVGRMQDYRVNVLFDMALCVFTVLVYLLDEESLQQAVAAVAKALRPGGQLLLNIPHPELFRDYRCESPSLKRCVTVSPRGDGLYLYEERIAATLNGERKSYADRFFIRCWKQEHVMEVLSSEGFSVAADLSQTFAGTGSHYFVMKRSDPTGRDQGVGRRKS